MQSASKTAIDIFAISIREYQAALVAHYAALKYYEIALDNYTRGQEYLYTSEKYCLVDSVTNESVHRLYEIACNAQTSVLNAADEVLVTCMASMAAAEKVSLYYTV